jgi:hypothetical protein
MTTGLGGAVSSIDLANLKIGIPGRWMLISQGMLRPADSILAEQASGLA